MNNNNFEKLITHVKKLPKELQILITNKLNGKRKRVFRHLLNLPRSPQKPQTRIYRRQRKGIYHNYYRFNKTPVVYKNTNWKYFLTAYAPNGTKYPIFFRSKNNVHPYVIHPRTGRRKNVNLYNHIIADENYTNNMIRRSRSRNTWNSYLRRL